MSAKTFELDFLPSPIIKSNPVISQACAPGITTVVDAFSAPLSVTIAADGSDYEIGLSDDGSGTFGEVNSDNRVSNGCASSVIILRDGVAVYQQGWGENNGTSLHECAVPVSSFKFIDTPSVGNHTYTVQVNNTNTGTNNNAIGHAILYAKKLRP